MHIRTEVFTDFATDDSIFSLAEGNEPAVNGSLKTACQISDALVLQYYEDGDVLFSVPGISVNVAHPLLEEMEKELMSENREFSFLCGHDSNILSVLSALDAEDYYLPDAIEKKTPIGSKLVVCRWADSSGEEFISLDLVYQKTEQLRNLSLLGIESIVIGTKISM